MESKKEHVLEILCQQMELLAEESKKVKPNDRGYKPSFVELSSAICRIADSFGYLLNTEKPKEEH